MKTKNNSETKFIRAEYLKSYGENFFAIFECEECGFFIKISLGAPLDFYANQKIPSDNFHALLGNTNDGYIVNVIQNKEIKNETV